MAAVNSQLSLALSLRDEATFDNFLAPSGSARAQVSQMLQGRLYQDEHFAYIWGGRGSGASHLLQASCHMALASGGGAQYLPLEDMAGFDPGDILESLEKLSLVCIQDINRVEGMANWEEALFTLFNKMRDRRRMLVVSADRAPRQLALVLPDLQSRLASGLTYHLAPYSDGDKADILRFRGARLGLDMGEEVAAFIVNRGSRELGQLMVYLQQLDVASLAARRRLTIPFVKEVFGW